jgi:hypothetical protein
MTNEQINIAIAEACNVKPVLVEWWAFKDDGKGGSICFQAQTKDEVEKWIAGLPKNSWAKDYVPKAFHRYPDYCNDLNAMHEAEKVLTRDQIEVFCDQLLPKHYGIWWGIHTTARQRAEAFLRTIGKWEGAK